jgi:hypothetical protein
MSPVSDARLEELRKAYRDLAAQPSRKAIGYSDAEHAEIMDELIRAREIFAALEADEEEAARKRERDADAAHNGGLSALGNALVESMEADE